MRRAPLLLLFAGVVALSACSATQEVLNPSDVAAAPPSNAAAANAGATAAPPPAAGAMVAARTRLHFDPIVGATVEAATPLTARLATTARSRGIAIAGIGDPATTHVMKGYFSLLPEGGDTTVIYVWDVYDQAGNRLHRINGQQKASGTAGAQGWAAVPAATMQAIADATIDQFAQWLAGSPASNL